MFIQRQLGTNLHRIGRGDQWRTLSKALEQAVVKAAAITKARAARRKADARQQHEINGFKRD